MSNPVSVIVFDLDNTLIDTDKRFHRALKSVKQYIKKVTRRGIDINQQSIIDQKPWLSIRHICSLFLTNRTDRQKEKIIERVLRYYYEFPFGKRDITEMKLFSNARRVFQFCKRAGYKIVLLTTGSSVIQNMKIKTIGTQWFDHIVVVEDSKEKALRSLIKRYNVIVSKSYIVGDKKGDEIAIGNKLRFITIHYCYGRHSGRPIRRDIEKAKYTVYNMRELHFLLSKLLKHD